MKFSIYLNRRVFIMERPGQAARLAEPGNRVCHTHLLLHVALEVQHPSDVMQTEDFCRDDEETGSMAICMKCQILFTWKRNQTFICYVNTAISISSLSFSYSDIFMQAVYAF